MNYRVVIHSIDLQDREGFLAFLDAYARKGYEAVRIFRSFTVFRKNGDPARGYSMRFLPEGRRRGESPRPLPSRGSKTGVEIFPVPGEDDVHWAEAVSTHYPDFVPYSLSHAIAVAVRQLVVVPIVLFVLVFLLRSGPGVGELLAAEIRSLFAWAVVFAPLGRGGDRAGDLGLFCGYHASPGAAPGGRDRPALSHSRRPAGLGQGQELPGDV